MQLKYSFLNHLLSFKDLRPIIPDTTDLSKPLVAPFIVNAASRCRGVFRTQSTIYDKAIFCENSLRLQLFSQKKMFDSVLNTPLH